MKKVLPGTFTDQTTMGKFSFYGKVTYHNTFSRKIDEKNIISNFLFYVKITHRNGFFFSRSLYYSKMKDGTLKPLLQSTKSTSSVNIDDKILFL